MINGNVKKESTSFPKVFLIILNWNSLKDTLECLESVYRIDYPSFEVIVVDNASSNNSPEVIHDNFPQAFLMRNYENLGYARGNNLAMQYALEHGADYVWLLNNDTVVEPDTLSKIVATAESTSDIGMVSPVIYYYHEPDRIQFIGCCIDHKMAVTYPDTDSGSIPDEFVKGKKVWLCGAAVLVKRKVMEKVGGFKEEFFAYWEDTDYSLRVTENHFRNVVDLTARIYHKTLPPQHGITRRGIHFYYYIARNKFFLNVQHTKGFRKIILICHYFADALSSINYFMKQPNSDYAVDAYLTGLSDALKNRSGQWNGIVKAPVWLKKICGLLCSWHPFFWIDLFRGEFARIAFEIFKRTKRSLSKITG